MILASKVTRLACWPCPKTMHSCFAAAGTMLSGGRCSQDWETQSSESRKYVEEDVYTLRSGKARFDVAVASGSGSILEGR